jgi:prepilin-type N-terminal cleavage/methylation domain-containing protein
MVSRPVKLSRRFPSRSHSRRGFTLVELLAAVVIISVLITLTVAAAQRTILASSLATSANNLRQLAAGAAAYLGDNNYRYWPWHAAVHEPGKRGTRWWFGFEPRESERLPDGLRFFTPGEGPLGGYVPAGLRPDPSFKYTGKPLKPKYRFGYIGIGYNVHLGGGWRDGQGMGYFELENPEKTVVFATSAQVNTFQRPASPSNPMIEEFYGFDDGASGNQASIHFRHPGGLAMVIYATGNAAFLPMHPGTLDTRAPEAQVGRLGPKGSTEYLR